LVVLVAVGLGIVVSPIVAVVALVAGLASVWLRGYLVPYTPSITARAMDVLSDTPKRGHGGVATTDAGSDGPVDETTGDDVVAALSTAGVLTADGEELSLTNDFREAWRTTIDEDRPSDLDAISDELQDAIDWVADASVVRDDGREWVQLTDADDNVHNETWLAPPAAVADLTAVRTLEDQTELTPTQRTLAAPSLRQFLDRCPVCDDDLVMSSPRACCGSPRYVAEGIEAVLSCPSCDEIVAAFEADE